MKNRGIGAEMNELKEQERNFPRLRVISRRCSFRYEANSHTDARTAWFLKDAYDEWTVRSVLRASREIAVPCLAAVKVVRTVVDAIALKGHHDQTGNAA